MEESGLLTSCKGGTLLFPPRLDFFPYFFFFCYGTVRYSISSTMFTISVFDIFLILVFSSPPCCCCIRFGYLSQHRQFAFLSRNLNCHLVFSQQRLFQRLYLSLFHCFHTFLFTFLNVSFYSNSRQHLHFFLLVVHSWSFLCFTPY